MYKKTYKILKTIFRSLKKGSSINEACRGAGIDVVTLWRWRKRDPKLDELVKTIYDSRIQIVEDALYKSALEGSNTAQIFFLKNRQPNRWRDVHDFKGEGFANKTDIVVHPTKTIIFRDMKEDANSEAGDRDTDAREGAEGSRIEKQI